MRVPILFAVAAMLASAQPRDAAFQASDRAYTALRARDYDVAVPAFLAAIDRKSTRLNSSHANISYAVFCLQKKARAAATSGRRATERKTTAPLSAASRR